MCVPEPNWWALVPPATKAAIKALDKIIDKLREDVPAKIESLQPSSSGRFIQALFFTEHGENYAVVYTTLQDNRVERFCFPRTLKVLGTHLAVQNGVKEYAYRKYVAACRSTARLIFKITILLTSKRACKIMDVSVYSTY